MIEPPCPKRVQIHLSTAIVMMFVAGGLLWANLREQHVDSNSREPFLCGYGWPRLSLVSGTGRPQFRNGRMLYYDMEPISIFGRKFKFHRFFASFNALISLAILFAVWFLCEWLIRRSEARK